VVWKVVTSTVLLITSAGILAQTMLLVTGQPIPTRHFVELKSLNRKVSLTMENAIRLYAQQIVNVKILKLVTTQLAIARLRPAQKIL
jgi:hypothetical protein